jgi:hypothetical protein
MSPECAAADLFGGATRRVSVVVERKLGAGEEADAEHAQAGI